MLSRGSKTLLKNVVRHTDTHNRIQEEAEMWRQKRLEHSSAGRNAHMDRERDEPSSGRKYEGREDPDPPQWKKASSYWSRQLQKAEAADPDRWGHSGYADLYPDEFVSSDEENEKKKCRKRPHSSSASKPFDRWDHQGFESLYPQERSQSKITPKSVSSVIHKLSKSKKKKSDKKSKKSKLKKKKAHRRSSTSPSETDSSDTEEDNHRNKSKKHKHKEKEYSESSSSSDSDNKEQYRKKRRKHKKKRTEIEWIETTGEQQVEWVEKK